MIATGITIAHQGKLVIVPDQCLHCLAPRAGVQEGVSHYRCGTKLRIISGRINVDRAPKCVGGAA